MLQKRWLAKHVFWISEAMKGISSAWHITSMTSPLNCDYQMPLQSYEHFFEAPDVPDSCLPLGMKRQDGSMKAVPIAPSKFLLVTILSFYFQVSIQ